MTKLRALLSYLPNWSPIFCGSATMAVLGLRDVNDLDVLTTDEVLDDLAAGHVPPGCTLRNDGISNPYDLRRVIRLETPDGGIDLFSELPRVGPLYGDSYSDSGPRVLRRMGIGPWVSASFLAPEIVMAIKCLVPPNHPKFRQHMADVAALAASHARGEWT